MRVNIEETELSSGRLHKFARLMGWHRRTAIGCLVDLWHDSVNLNTPITSKQNIVDWVKPDTEEEGEKIFAALCNSGYLQQVDADLFDIGTAHDAKVLHNLRKNSKKGGRSNKDRHEKLSKNNPLTAQKTESHMASHVDSQIPEPNTIQYNTIQNNSIQDTTTLPPDSSSKNPTEEKIQETTGVNATSKIEIIAATQLVDDCVPGKPEAPPQKNFSLVPKKQKQKSESAEANRHFRAEYFRVLGHEPKLGAADNSKLAAMVRKIGRDDSLLVISQYFNSPNPYYKQKGYAVGIMLTDADRLWAEVKTPVLTVENLAVNPRSMAVQANNALVFDRLLAKARAN